MTPSHSLSAEGGRGRWTKGSGVVSILKWFPAAHEMHYFWEDSPEFHRTPFISWHGFWLDYDLGFKLFLLLHFTVLENTLDSSWCSDVMVKAQVSSKAVHLDGCHLRLAGEREVGRGFRDHGSHCSLYCIVYGHLFTLPPKTDTLKWHVNNREVIEPYSVVIWTPWSSISVLCTWRHYSDKWPVLGPH